MHFHFLHTLFLGISIIILFELDKSFTLKFYLFPAYSVLYSIYFHILLCALKSIFHIFVPNIGSWYTYFMGLYVYVCYTWCRFFPSFFFCNIEMHIKFNIFPFAFRRESYNEYRNNAQFTINNKRQKLYFIYILNYIKYLQHFTPIHDLITDFMLCCVSSHNPQDTKRNVGSFATSCCCWCFLFFGFVWIVWWWL